MNTEYTEQEKKDLMERTGMTPEEFTAAGDAEFQQMTYLYQGRTLTFDEYVAALKTNKMTEDLMREDCNGGPSLSESEA